MYKSILSKNIKKEHIEFLNKPIEQNGSNTNDTNDFDINTDHVTMANFFHANGYVIIKDGVDKTTVDLLRKDLNDINKKDGRYENKTKTNKTNNNNNNFGRHTVHKRFFENSSTMVKQVVDSKLTDFCQYLIADGVGGRGNNLTAHLVHNNAFSVPSGGKGQAPSWHVDDAIQNVIIEGNNKLPDYIKLPVMILTCMVWLSDCTDPSNGPTWVVPGSHRFGREVDPNYANSHCVPMCGKSGTVVIINSQLWHRGSSNDSNVPRETVQITFGRRIISHMFGSIMDYRLPQHVLNFINKEISEEKRQKAKEIFGYLQGGAYS